MNDNNDGTYDVYIELPENEWIYGYILSLGNSVEVIDPSHIREGVIKRMKLALSVYE
ncbi:MAG: WYL domain-containing protein [Peptostreptococcaceae bacterium]